MKGWTVLLVVGVFVAIMVGAYMLFFKKKTDEFQGGGYGFRAQRPMPIKDGITASPRIPVKSVFSDAGTGSGGTGLERFRCRCEGEGGCGNVSTSTMEWCPCDNMKPACEIFDL